MAAGGQIVDVFKPTPPFNGPSIPFKKTGKLDEIPLKYRQNTIFTVGLNSFLLNRSLRKALLTILYYIICDYYYE